MPGYKAKTIKAIISGKINKWVESIDDVNVRQLVKKNVTVTGGCIVSMLLGEEVNDFDVYFKDHQTTLAVAEYYVKKFREKHTENTKFDLFVTDFGGRVKIKAQSAGVASAASATEEYRYKRSLEPGREARV